MYTSFISTWSLQSAPRLALADHQRDIARSSREIATGRLDDAGLALGARTGQAVDLRIEDTRVSRFLVGNGVVEARMDQTQLVLDQVVDTANDVLRSLTALPPSATAVTALVTQARAALDTLVARLNVSDGGFYLFAGIDSGNRPISDYDGAPKAAVDAAKTARFLGTTIPPATSPADIDDFIDNYFAPIFDPAGWSASWSSADDTQVTAEIEPGRIADVTVTANEAPFRRLAMAYTMLADFDLESLRSDARQRVIDRALGLVGGAIGGVIGLQAEFGLVQEEVKEASARLRSEEVILRTRLEALEGIDTAEAKTEVDRLTTQIEMSYALTVRLNRLTILDFA